MLPNKNNLLIIKVGCLLINQLHLFKKHNKI